MKSWHIIAAIVVFISFAQSSCEDGAFCLAGKMDNIIDGQIVVKFADSVGTEKEASLLIKSYGLGLVGFLEPLDLLAVVETPVGEECKWIDKLEALPEVEYAHVRVYSHIWSQYNLGIDYGTHHVLVNGSERAEALAHLLHCGSGTSIVT